MQFHIQQKELERALNFLQKAIPARPQLPVLSALLITTTKDTCSIAATDLYFGVRVTMPITESQEGSVAVPGKEFRELIQSLPSTATVQLTLNENTVTLTAGKIRCTLQCLDSKDYPAFPELSGETISLSSTLLQQVVKYVTQSTSLDQARPLLTGILFSFSDSTVRCVGTDGFRLSILDAESMSSYAESFILPAKTLAEAVRIIDQLSVSEAVLTISKTLKQVYCTAEGVEIFMRLLEGEYPPYQKIIPVTHATELVVSAEVLIEQVKRALIYSRDSSSVITFSITEQHCSISATSSTLGNYHAEVEEAQVKGTDVTISFKAKYLLDFLSTVPDSDIWMGMNESLKPVLFKAQKVSNLQYVVMPFRVT